MALIEVTLGIKKLQHNKNGLFDDLDNEIFLSSFA